MRIVFSLVTLCVAILALANVSLFAQQLYIGELKAALVGQFVKHIAWPNTDKDSIDILVLEDRSTYEQLVAIDGAIINDKELAVKFTPVIKALPDTDILYISDKVQSDVSNLLALMRGNGTLVITENSGTLHNVMINIFTTEEQGS